MTENMQADEALRLLPVVFRGDLNIFLSSLPEKNRNIFLLRYWYFIPVRDIARRCGMTEGAVKMILQRVRSKLKEYLEKEGVGI